MVWEKDTQYKMDLPSFERLFVRRGKAVYSGKRIPNIKYYVENEFELLAYDFTQINIKY